MQGEGDDYQRGKRPIYVGVWGIGVPEPIVRHAAGFTVEILCQHPSDCHAHERLGAPSEILDGSDQDRTD